MFSPRSAYTTESYLLVILVFIYHIHGSMRFELDILFGTYNACVFYLIRRLEILQDNISEMYFLSYSDVYHVKRKMSIVLET